MKGDPDSQLVRSIIALAKEGFYTKPHSKTKYIYL